MGDKYVKILLNQAIALEAAVDYFNKIGIEQIHAYEAELTAYLI